MTVKDIYNETSKGYSTQHGPIVGSIVDPITAPLGLIQSD